MLQEIKEPKSTNGRKSSATLTTVATSNPVVPVPDGFNPNCKIINNSGFDLMVLDAHASSDTADEVLFEQDLKILAASDGSSIIKNGTAATFVMNDSYYNDLDEAWEYSYGYNLLIVRADNLFPVKIVGLLPQGDDMSYFDDITVTAGKPASSGTAAIEGDYESMIESQAFQQNYMAFPDSVTSKNYLNTLKDANDQSASVSDIDAKVTAFFQATDNYKNANQNSVTAIQTYWNVFPYIWAGYAASKSYYLYTSDGTTTTYLGSLDITAPATASVDKTLPGFTFYFTPADTKKARVPLRYIDGQFVDNVDTTTIALKGLYQLKSLFTKNDADNVITAFMTGSVNGQKVLGFNEKVPQKSDGSNDWSGFYAMLHPKDAAGWLALVLEIGAVAMTIELFSRPLVKLAQKVRDYKAKKNGAEPSPAEVDKMRTEVKNAQAQDVVDSQRIMDRMGTDIRIKIDLDFNNSTAQLTVERNNRVTEDSRSNLTDITARQMDSVRTLSRYSMDNTIQSMSGKIRANNNLLDPTKTTTADLALNLDAVKANVQLVNDTLPVETTKLASKTTAAEKLALDAAKRTNDEALEIQDEIEKSKDTLDKGDDGDVDLDDLPKGPEK